MTHFKDLHRPGHLLVLPNVWNARSAAICQGKGFPAVATSSAAVAHSLGYEDGENMPWEDYLFVIRRILSVLRIPLSVDIEMGYGATDEKILDNVLVLAGLGVQGINIEDSTFKDGRRVLKDPASFARTIERIKTPELFINVRCDTYLLNVDNKRKDTEKRLKAYAAADGIFLPCITEEADITAAVFATPLPLNVMSVPGLPDQDTLRRLGVQRLSMGSALFDRVYAQLV
ncbi:isocitrate lyase/PEP mutase family protein [Dinghuibacter silviterrae]|uniref:2-methylisocitrate lyase-like PEP mutase family enzyme n=1 Tax=Dinghuibacter silviterrae TaxID=1539049 RepID=A0A4R8DX94_9BACT|nr:isocitrate lyase/phosphoenolpyruvate mutase family protein [Dinghuibacter silviterrae]TDX02057.1 2-methylisocitrate lyase-like PEP mutase family enzyme [Dinghuibacter silviterrae]